jgi:subtilisin family serine protease
LVLPSASADAGAPSDLTSPPLAAALLLGQDHVTTPSLNESGPANLVSSLQSIAAAARHGADAAIARAETLSVPYHGSDVRVVVTGTTGADALAAIRSVGATVEAAAETEVQALVAPAALGRLAGEANVILVAPPATPVAQSIVGEEIGTTHATAWQAAGITGRGVKVAVIDLGFAGLAAAQASGELPASALTSDDCGGGFSSVTAHGTAVAEIVHEIAPDAQLLLVCVNSAVTLAVAEQWAVAQGATIINHSVAWFDTARGDGSGGTGTPDAVVADAAAHGVLWVNAAGNYAQDHWSGVFTDTDHDSWEDFAPGDEGQSVFVPAGSSFCALMRWDEWSGPPADDYDLYIAASGSGTVVADSLNRQPAHQSPTEEACYTPSVDGFYFAAIQRFSGSGSPRIDLFTIGGSAGQYQVAAGSVTDPAASPNALAVGAVCWQNGALEPYSSQGPTIDGRTKPDLVADDRMSSFTYGLFDSCSGVGGFAGTSAASPTVAGLAALIKQLYPADTGTQLRAYLTSHALDSGPNGSDSQYGAGRALLQPSLSTPLAAVAPSTTGTPTPGHTLTGVQGTWTGDGNLTFADQWQRCDAQGGNCGSATSGVTYDVTSADVASTLRLQVTATSAVGSSQSSMLTGVIGAAVQTPATGGGGSGGGSSVPNLGVTIAPRATVLAPGDADEIIIYVKNAGGAGALQSHLIVQLPASVALLGAPYFERGSGCKGTSSIDCFLDYIPNGETTKVILEVRATAAGAQLITTAVSADRDSDPTNNTASVTLQVGIPAVAPLPPSRAPSSGRTFNGTAGANHLTGTAFADILNGFGGNDILRGGKGNDVLNGGSGNDTLTGGSGLDRLFGGAGNDAIHALDGQRDTIDCGAGRDIVFADRLDRVAKNCETVRR